MAIPTPNLVVKCWGKRQTRCRCYIIRLELKFGRTRGPRDSSHYKWHQMEKEDFFVSSCQMELVHAMPTKFQVLIRLLFCKFLVWHPADNICGKLLSLSLSHTHTHTRSYTRTLSRVYKTNTLDSVIIVNQR